MAQRRRGSAAAARQRGCGAAAARRRGSAAAARQRGGGCVADENIISPKTYVSREYNYHLQDGKETDSFSSKVNRSGSG